MHLQLRSAASGRSAWVAPVVSHSRRRHAIRRQPAPTHGHWALYTWKPDYVAASLVEIAQPAAQSKFPRQHRGVCEIHASGNGISHRGTGSISLFAPRKLRWPFALRRLQADTRCSFSPNIQTCICNTEHVSQTWSNMTFR